MVAKNCSFAEKVRGVVKKIPAGQVLSYGEVAKLAGSPGAARAVGGIMKKNFDKSVPCHRVVLSDGRIGNYNRGGSKAKIDLLLEEGASIVNGKVAVTKKREV